MLEHTKLSRQKQQEVFETAAPVQTSYVQQTARLLDGQFQQIQNPYSSFLRNLSTPPDSVQVPETAKAKSEHLGY